MKTEEEIIEILKEVADIARVNPDNIDYDRVLERICLPIIHQITKEKIIKILKDWKVEIKASEEKLIQYFDCEDNFTQEDLLRIMVNEICSLAISQINEDKIVKLLEKHFGIDNNFIITTKSKRYNLIAEEILRE